MQSQFVGFNTLKQSVSMTQVLDRYGLLEHLKRSGDSLFGVCPVHHGHNPGQFRVSLSKNCWICFGDCGAGGSIIDFVARMEGVGVRDAGMRIQAWFAVPFVETVRPKPEAPERTSNPPLRLSLVLDYSHPYLGKRGLTQETIETFDIGYCSHGLMSGRIVIPIHNAKGELVAYAGRLPGNQGVPKYLLPAGFRKSLELFNLHRAIQAEPSDPFIIVEGFFGCLKLWQAGFRRVVSLMGSRLSEAQAELIIKTVGKAEKVILLLDEDEAGRKGREQARLCLCEHLEMKVIKMPAPWKQPDQLCSEELRQLLK